MVLINLAPESGATVPVPFLPPPPVYRRSRVGNARLECEPLEPKFQKKSDCMKNT